MFQGVAQTALRILWAEYLAGKQVPEIWNNPKIDRLVENLDYDFSTLDIPSDEVLYIAVRKKTIDDLVKIFVCDNPDGIIVNLGCGLNNLHARHSGANINWYDLDLPQIITTKRQFFDETEKYQMIAESALNFSWMSKIPKNRKALFLIEGLLPYFYEEEVKVLLEELMKQFPDQELIILAVSNWRVYKSQKKAVRLSWGLSSGKIITSWYPKLELKKEYHPFAFSSSKWSLKMQFLHLFPIVRNQVKIIHLNDRNFNGV